MNNNDENNSSFDITELNHNDIINPKTFHLFKNFLTKENKSLFKKEISPAKEIMPDYLDIDLEIQKKINQIRTFYGTDQLFKDMQSYNSYVMTIFRKGFRNLFFGPKGIVTKKSLELKKYYKSFESKADLTTKINAGSLDYYDFLSKYSSFFARLKNSRKKILKMGGNFTVADTKSEKLHAAYLEYEKRRRKKNEQLRKKFRRKNMYINTSGNNTNSESKSKSRKSKNINKTNNNFYNTYIKEPKKAFLLGKKNESDEKIKTQNIFLNYKKDVNIMKNNNFQPYKINYTVDKIDNNNLDLSTKKEDNSNDKTRKKAKQNTGEYSHSRDIKKKLTNITTVMNKTHKRASISMPKSYAFKNLIYKHRMPLEERVAKRKNIYNYSNLINRTKIFNISHHSNSKMKIFNYFSNKNLETTLFKGRMKNIEIETIKQSLNNKIATIPSNKRIAHQLYEFINNSKKYELKKKNLYQKSMKEELLELKEDMKNVAGYHDLIKKVDFSDIRRFSPKNNHKVKNKVKGSSINLAFSFKTRLEQNLPIKEFLQNLEKIKEKEREKKFIKFVRSNFKKNNRQIHNLTVSLDHIKKKYNY